MFYLEISTLQTIVLFNSKLMSLQFNMFGTEFTNFQITYYV